MLPLLHSGNDIRYRRWEPILLLLAALSMFVYGFYIVWFSADGPFAEEHELLRFFIAWHDASSWQDKYQALVIPATDHKPVTAYLISLFMYHIIDRVDFVYLGYLANLAAVALLLCIVYPFRQSRHFAALVFVAALLGFQLIPLGNMFWAEAGLADNLSLLFALLALLFLCRQTLFSTLLAVIFSACAIYSLVNGILVLPAALMLLFCTRSPNPDRDQPAGHYRLLNRAMLIRQLLLFEAVGLMVVFLYLADNPPSLSPALAVVEFELFHFLWIFLRLLGGGFSYDNEILQCLSGAGILVLCADLFRRGYQQQQPALAAYMAFLIATILALCVYRNWTLLDPYANVSRYYFWGMQIWIVLALCYAELYLAHLSRAGKYLLPCLVAIIISSFTFSYWLKTRDVVNICLNKKMYSQSQVIKVSGKNARVETSYDEILQQSMALGYFNPDRLFSEKPPRRLGNNMACFTGLINPQHQQKPVQANHGLKITP